MRSLFASYNLPLKCNLETERRQGNFPSSGDNVIIEKEE
jgi:hypothetical protein